MTAIPFKGKAKPLDDVDLPRLASRLGAHVGEDPLHAFMDTESLGSGFYPNGSVKRLYEPHVAYRDAGPGPVRDALVKAGLAYPEWGMKPYPKDSTDHILKAAEIAGKEFAYRATSWGGFQVLGENFAKAGFESAVQMVEMMQDDEEVHLWAAINFLKNSGLADDMDRLGQLERPVTPEDCEPIVRVYNGAGYRKNNYHVKFAAALNKWKKIRDTEWDGDENAGAPPVYPTRVTPAAKTPRPVVPDAQALLAVQKQLLRLGYTEVGKPDGKMGPKTRAAILAFRDAQGLPLTPTLDDQFMAKLMMAEPREVAPERQQATMDDLREGGSRIIQHADKANGGAAVLGGAGAVGVALQGIDVLGSNLDNAKGLLDRVAPFKQALADAGPYVLIGIAAFIIWQLWKAKQARLDDHRTGKTATPDRHSVIEVPR